MVSVAKDTSLNVKIKNTSNLRISYTKIIDHTDICMEIKQKKATVMFSLRSKIRLHTIRTWLGDRLIKRCLVKIQSLLQIHIPKSKTLAGLSLIQQIKKMPLYVLDQPINNSNVCKKMILSKVLKISKHQEGASIKKITYRSLTHRQNRWCAIKICL